MSKWQVEDSVDKIFQAVFGRNNPYDIQTLEEKFAFDIKLPTEVKDSTTGEITYTAAPNAKQFIKDANSQVYGDDKGWIQPKCEIKSLDQVLDLWQKINLMTTERAYNCENVQKSDPVYDSTNVYKSTNCGACHDIIFCDGTYESNFAMACQRSTGLNYCLRVDDSSSCTNSYNVICSGKVSNSMFIQDCGELHECIFCSHISNREYHIANMPFKEAEYFALKAKILEWIFKV